MNPNLGIRPTQRNSGRVTRRTRGRRTWTVVEALEDRRLLAITSTTPVPVSVIETNAFSGAVMDFTSNDPSPQNAANYSATIDWGDGTTTGSTVAPLAGGGFAVDGTHTYAEDGTHSVLVTIQDLVDATSAANNTTATVREFSLTATGVDVTGPEGTPLTNVTVGTFTDPGSPDPASAYSATIDWGDGTTTAGTVGGAAGSYTVSGTHTYAPDEGTHPISVTFAETTDPTFTVTSSSTATITEADVLSGGAVAIATGGVEGKAINGTVATFNDTGFPANVAADFSAVINWGDGTTTPGTVVASGAAGSFAVTGTHTYSEEGVNPFSAVVTDNAPGTASITIAGPVTIADAPLTASPVAVNGTEGSPLTNVDVATFTDADPLGTVSDFLTTINWGDGTTSAGTVVEDAAGTFHVQGSHTYTEESATTFSIGVSIIDNGNGRAVTDPTNSTASTTSTASIRQSPLLAVANAVVATEGTAVPVTTPVATFTDTGGADPVSNYSATINWGDGSATVPATIALLGNGGNFVVSPSAAHTYTEEGTFPVTVTITDIDTGNGVPTTVLTTSAAHVADATLTLPAAQPTVNATEGVSFTLPVASFNDANPVAPVGDFTATIDWGDGTPQSAGTISQRGGTGTAFVVTGTHTYADAGVNGGVGHFPITVYVADAGGSKLTVNNTANVADVAITLTGHLNPASDTGQSNTDGITNDNQPNFLGTSEPFSHITLFATPTTGGPTFPIGQTEAGSDGSWSITSSRLADGSYAITGSAVDQFGKTTTGFTVPAGQILFLPNATQGPLVIDTVGPRITNVFFNRLNGKVDVTFQDDRSGLNQATLLDSANYQLTKPHTPPATFLVTNLNAVPPALPTDPESVAVVFNSGRGLRGGFYTFTIRDSSRGPSTVQDVAGNSLDGEFYGTFPSGNGIPGGDFVAMLDTFHNKVFAPQTVVGTANAANGGQGGAPVGAPHSGVFTILPPRVPGGDVLTAGAFRVRQAVVVPRSHPHGPRHPR